MPRHPKKSWPTTCQVCCPAVTARIATQVRRSTCRLNVVPKNVKNESKHKLSKATAAPIKRKSNPKNKKARKIVARNTTYASKQKCADRDAVKEFLAHGDCGCDAKCIKVLQRLQDDGALDVVLTLRKQRFASKCYQHTTCRCCDLFPLTRLVPPPW